MMKTYKAVTAMILAVALVACGGGGGSAGTNPNASSTSSTTTTTDTTTTPTAQSLVADFALFTDKTAINNTGTDSAKVTVVAVDSSRNVVSGAPVSISTDASSFFVPTSTQTDATGAYSGNVQAGADKTDRDITVTATVNGIVKKTTVRVTGSKLVLSATPAASVNPGTNVVVKATLTDSSNNPIQGQSIRLGGTIPAVQALSAVTTNALGEAVFPGFAAPALGTYTISGTGGGTSAVDYTLSVFTVGAVPVAVIPVGAATPSFAATPKVLASNSPGSSTNKSTLRFQFVNVNTPIPNVRVQLLDLTPGQKLGTLSTDNTVAPFEPITLYTDSSGTVTGQYVSGTTSSATDGVRIRACYAPADFTPGDIANCRAGVRVAGVVDYIDTLLTIAGQAIAVSIGDDNVLSKGSGTYIKRFAVTVADSAGRAVANAPVDISVDLTHYGKGPTAATYGGVVGTTGLPQVPLSLTQAYPAMDASTAAQRVWCPNEDVNRNGIVDTVTNGTFGPFTGAVPVITTENYNGSTDGAGQATLDPRKSDLIISYDDATVTSTNSSGVLVIKVEYSQRFSTWLAYKVRVTANVAGSQGVAERTFVTDFLEVDKLTGSFLTPPYGTGNCRAAN